ncbi:MAG: metallophosphoesterase [Actinomycetota bacterium]|nr:metallophosphoesterase [Actinomycetota bacterium]
MIRVAAVGDLHFGTDSAGTLRPSLNHLSEWADLLLLAGDLTRVGVLEEAEVLAQELGGLPLPVIAVLGNHDYHADLQEEMSELLRGVGITVLEGDWAIVDVDGHRVGLAGTKGFGGGFPGASGSDFGEPEMKAFMAHSKQTASLLEKALQSLDADVRIALLHYAPIRETLQGEKLEIYPFLGSSCLSEAIDRAGADLVIHGHAHHGSEKGMTPGGIRVRNVAQPVIRQAYALYSLPVGEP